MLLFTAPDGVIREAPFDCSFADDPKDYFCGRGVLLRYLAEIQNDLHPGFDFTAGIQATAAAVVNTASESMFAQNWTSEATDLVFNKNFKSLWIYGDEHSERAPSAARSSHLPQRYLPLLSRIDPEHGSVGRRVPAGLHYGT